ncbi:MAG: class I tRNA ligase family protein, partial [Candidatus Daviesbacteria bacterium]|nr:class I tRNA ligase family protein [Candidatus Daviesbacteria bacterium]
MDKVYNQKEVEEKWYKQSFSASKQSLKIDEASIYRFWEESGFFKADPSSSKPGYSLLMPPPNVTGALHLGHAMQHSIMDAVARFKRMQGFDVLLLPGVDHAGIQFEGTLNKLLEKEGTSKYKLGREEWLKRAWKFKEESYNSVSKTWRMMGLSADWSREVFTLDTKVEKAVFTEFKTFWDEDLLYKGAYIVQWCPKDQTAIEDVEMEYEEKKEKLYYVKYQIATSGASSVDVRKPGFLLNDYIVVATARPETIFADSGIAIYPEHPDFKKYEGMNATNPLTGQSIPIFSDERVKKDFGSGALKITPGHGLLDYEIGKDHNLPIRHAIDKTGRMTTLAGKFVGLKVAEARDQIGNELSHLNALGWKDKKTGIEKSAEQYTHSVPVCERCKTTVEPLISEEWFVNMKPLAQKALKRIGEVNFVPSNYQKILSDWMKDLHDWSISRSLWWGHRIPVWYCQKCNPNHLVGKDKDMVVSMEHPAQNCQTCKLNEWIQDDQLLDTWFSSGLWPMATLGWPDQTPEFKKYFPWSFEISAGEIKYLWIARMIMLSLHFTDKIP